MLKRVVLLGCLLVGTVAHAAEDYPHNFWLGYSQDENQTKSLDALLSLGLGLDDQLFIGAGQTDFIVKDLTALVPAEETATVYNFSVLYSTLRLAPWSVDIGYDFWGKHQELEIHTLNLGTAWYNEMWMLGVNLEQRKITIYTQDLILLGGQREADIDSTGLGPNLGLLADNWVWNLTGMYYDYSKDVSKLEKLKTLIRAYYVLGPRTFAHTTALAEWYINTEFKYRFTDVTLGAKYSHTVLATDFSKTDSVSMLMDVKLSKRVNMDLEAGQVYTPDDTTVAFGSIGLSIDF